MCDQNLVKWGVVALGIGQQSLQNSCGGQNPCGGQNTSPGTTAGPCAPARTPSRGGVVPRSNDQSIGMFCLSEPAAGVHGRPWRPTFGAATGLPHTHPKQTHTHTHTHTRLISWPCYWHATAVLAAAALAAAQPPIRAESRSKLQYFKNGDASRCASKCP